MTQKKLDAATRKLLAKQKKDRAVQRGVQRGSWEVANNVIHQIDEPPLQLASADEGLHVLVQTGHCRRVFLTKVYNNKLPSTYLDGTRILRC